MRKTSGLCIRRVDFSETSQIATFFTRDEGRISLIAKGARRKRSPTQGRIDLFSCGELVYVAKRVGTLNILAEFHPEESFTGLRETLPRAYAAFYMAELLQAGMPEGLAHPDFFDFCVELLGAIVSNAPSEVARMMLDAHFLDELGSTPLFRICAECGKELPLRGQVAYAVALGGALCRACAPGDAWSVPVGALGVVEGLRRTAPAAAGRISISQELRGFVREILSSSVVYALDRKPKMMQLG